MQDLRRLFVRGEDGVAPGWAPPMPDAAQRRADVVTAAALAAGAIGMVVLTLVIGWPADTKGHVHRPALAEEVAWCLAVTLPLAWRRRYPQAALVAVALAYFGLQVRGVGEPVVSQISLFLALFTAGAWARERAIGRAVRGLIVVLMFAWIAYSLAYNDWDELRERAPLGPMAAVVAFVLFNIALNLLFFGGAYRFGDVAWRSAARFALLQERTEELARERDENARRAVLDERVRIARELHDVVAHHVSVMGVQAGAARMVLDSDPEAAREALARVEQSSRDAVGEMRRLLGVLRSAPGEEAPGQEAPVEYRPSPDLTRVDDLVADARAGGLRAECTVVGDPVPLPPSLSVSAYRIVQESLTNTRRHAGASRADVRLRYLDGAGGTAFEVEVVDDGRAAPGTSMTGHGAGLGIVGMRERAALHGAELEIGPRPGGGFRVRARFPLTRGPGGTGRPGGTGVPAVSGKGRP